MPALPGKPALLGSSACACQLPGAQNGLLYCPAAAGLAGNVFRIKPPMCWTKADVDFTIAVLDQALSEL